MKACSRCKETKSLEEFHRDRTRKGGRNPMCKKCHSENYQQKKEFIKKYSKEYWQKNREKLREKNKKYRDRHRDYQRKWYAKNRDRILEQKERDKILSKLYRSENIHGISFGEFRERMRDKPLYKH